MRGLRAGEQDRDEPRAAGLVVVDPVVDQAPFPAHPEALTGLLLAHDAAAVGLGADHQDELGLVEVPVHPAGPALRRRRVDVPVEDHVDPAVAEGVGQGEDAGGVLVRVVAVAEEHPRRVRHRADPLRRSLVRRNRLLHYQANGTRRPTRDGGAGSDAPAPARIDRDRWALLGHGFAAAVMRTRRAGDDAGQIEIRSTMFRVTFCRRRS